MNYVVPLQSKLRKFIKDNTLLNASIFLIQNAFQLVYFWNPLRVRKVKQNCSRRYRIGIMVRVKDEGKFILEWIGHHILAGVDHIYIYDNGSTDNTREILQDVITKGYVTYIYWPTKPISPNAEMDFFQRFGSECEWVAFLDADEFIVSRQEQQLYDLLSNVHGPALALNWRLFGSSWVEEPKDNCMLQELVYSDSKLNRHVKVIVRPCCVKAYRNPHNFYYKSGRLAHTIDGTRVYGSFATAQESSEIELWHYIHRGRFDSSRKAGMSVTAEGHFATRDESYVDANAHNDQLNKLPPLHLNALARWVATHSA